MNDRPDVVFAQSAAIPYRIKKGSPQVLLITSRRRRRWIVPKGIIEEWQSPQEAAADESYEEAGVRGSVVGDPVGKYEYEKWGGTCRVELYLLQVEEVLPDWPESDLRERKWVGIDEALELIDNDELCQILQKAVRLMD
jgi:8-oxo-dGTP pyrophosphatase MutT (NUDIX family)